MVIPGRSPGCRQPQERTHHPVQHVGDDGVALDLRQLDCQPDSGAGEVGACTPQYDLGVTVGKFFPLHRGHALLISRASAVVRRLVVLCSGRDGDSVPMATRAAWIRSLFPDRARIEVLEVVDGLSEAPVRLATPGLFVLGTD